MIKYNLICERCDNSFNSWFASSKEYEKLKKKNLIDCHLCNSFQVKKNLMSPNILNSKKEKLEIIENNKYLKIKKKIKEYQKVIKKNFKYVGKNFVYEARSIHHENKKTLKGIYGNASAEEVKELKDEGIDTDIIPWVNENDN